MTSDFIGMADNSIFFLFWGFYNFIGQVMLQERVLETLQCPVLHSRNLEEILNIQFSLLSVLSLIFYKEMYIGF